MLWMMADIFYSLDEIRKNAISTEVSVCQKITSILTVMLWKMSAS